LTPWQHTTHTDGIHDRITLSACLEVYSLHSLLESMREYSSYFRSDSSIDLYAFKRSLVEDKGSAGLIVGSIFVEIRFLVFVAHVENKIKW
jgi:hypothetical protein